MGSDIVQGLLVTSIILIMGTTAYKISTNNSNNHSCNIVAEKIDPNAKWESSLGKCVAIEGDSVVYYTFDNDEIQAVTKTISAK